MVLYFMVDWVNPWVVRELDQFILWVDGCFWGCSLWDVDVVLEDGEEDALSERVQVV